MNDFALARKLHSCLPCLAVFALSCVSIPAPASACRYNVRDASFVDLGNDGYQLEISPPEAVSREVVDQMKVSLAEALANANVRVVSNASSADRPQIGLAAPTGARLEMELETQDWSAPAELAEHLAEQLLPPLSEEIVDVLIDAHSVVLLVEGGDAEDDQRIARAANKAVEVALLGRPEWAKPIDVDPQLMIVSREQVAAASVLLWSLGVEADATAPQLVVLCGRGRPVGPVFAGEEPRQVELELRRRLSYVSQDCECELDRTWMHRAGFPHAWTSRHERQIAARLGFDPGSPLVTAEVRQIVARHRLASPGESRESVEPPPLYGYQEFDLSSLPGLEDEPIEQQSALVAEPANVSRPVQTSAAPETVDTPIASSMRRSLWAVTIVSAVGGALLWMFAGRRG